jgi:hypothetical protein
MIGILEDRGDVAVVQELASFVAAMSETNKLNWSPSPGWDAPPIRSRMGTIFAPRPLVLTPSEPDIPAIIYLVCPWEVTT